VTILLWARVGLLLGLAGAAVVLLWAAIKERA
jgi:hypothetical protein